MFFFCQAEDGIRDLVRSRGLGDVYKRQVETDLVANSEALFSLVKPTLSLVVAENEDGERADDFVPVSYTHLTLPTSDLV